MMPLKRKDDPTGFLSLFRFEASTRFGDPSGHIHPRGKYEHRSKKGPGRRPYPTKSACQHGGKWLSPNVSRRGR